MKFNRLSLLIVLLFHSQAWACLSSVSPLPILDPMFALFHDELNKYAATDEQIQNAVCKTKSAPSYVSMMNYYKGQKPKLSQKTIHGVSFVNESPAALKAFEQLTTAVNSSGEDNSPERQVRLQERFKINPDCQSVACAVEKIWGVELGTKLLFMKMRFGFNGSDLAFNYAVRFENEELDDVLMALGDMSAEFHPIGRDNQPLIHYRHPDFQDGTSIADPKIQLTDLWVNKTRPYRQYAVYHELSHKLGLRNKMIESRADWLAVSGWKQTVKDKWEPDKKACFMSAYASKKDPSEDWAESLSTYRYNALNFKKDCPEKYNFIKDQFYQGKEYASPLNCSTHL